MKLVPNLILLLSLQSLAAQDSSIQPFDGTSNELLAKGLKLYPIESGAIHYTVDGQPEDALTFYFDRFGWRQLTLEKGEKAYYGIKTSIHTRVIKDGTAVHTINMLDNKAVTTRETEFADLAVYKKPDELLLAQMSRLNAKRTGTSVLLEKECDVWEYISKGKPCQLWIWNSLILKDQGPKVTITADKMDINLAIDEKTFQLPNGITWRLPSSN